MRGITAYRVGHFSIPLHINLCATVFVMAVCSFSAFCHPLTSLVFIPAHQNSHAESTGPMDTSKSES